MGERFSATEVAPHVLDEMWLLFNLDLMGERNVYVFNCT